MRSRALPGVSLGDQTGSEVQRDLKLPRLYRFAGRRHTAGLAVYQNSVRTLSAA
jgi:hypothetical protein